MNNYLIIYNKKYKVGEIYSIFDEECCFDGERTFRDGFYQSRQADMGIFFKNIPWLFVVMAPAAAMRLWAEERKSGSVELLFTLPITVTQAVIAKFMAAWTFLAISAGVNSINWAKVNSGNSSVTSGPIICAPKISPYLASVTNFTQPA